MNGRVWALVLAGACALGPSAAQAAKPKDTQGCRAGLEAAPEERESWACFYTRARATGDWAQAAASLRELMEDPATAPRSPTVEGYALLALANVVAEQDPSEGIELYERARAQLGQGEDRLALLLTLLNLAYRYRSTGMPQRGAAVLSEAVEVAEAHGDPKWIATASVEGVRHELRTQGDLAHASQLLARSEGLLFPDGDYQAKLNWLHAAGSVARNLDQIPQALSYAERSIALAAEAGDAYVEATSRHNALQLQLELHGPRSALGLMPKVREAAELARAGGNEFTGAALECMVSDLLRDQGELDEALTAAQTCAEAGARLEDPRIEVEGLLAQIRVGLDQHARRAWPEREQELEQLLARAIRISRESEAVEQSIVSAALDAELRWRLDPPERARAASEVALAQLERLREQQGDPRSRAEFLARRSEVYQRYVHLLIQTAYAQDGGRDAEASSLLASAFDVMERHRAVALRETLARARAEPQQGLAPVSFGQLAARLGDQEVVLAYQLGSEIDTLVGGRREGWVLAMSKGQIAVQKLPAAEKLRARVEMFAAAVEAEHAGSGARGLDQAAQELGRELVLMPLAQLGGKPRRVHLLLDGGLHGLPFAALHDEHGRPLIERLEFDVLPSATALVQARERPVESSATQLLALADPRPLAERWSGPGEVPLDLPPLPHARAEVEAIARGPADSSWVGPEASEGRLLAHPLDEIAVLHFAAHALVDSVRPERSAIVLARDENAVSGEQGGAHDGLLQPAEITQLNLEGKLVVLAACASATGQRLEGEGVMGLSHAMFEAGASTVVGSLWPTRDDHARELMTRFYTHLARGVSVAEALRAAQVELVKAGAPSSAWAGIVVLGDGGQVPFRGGHTIDEQGEVEDEGGAWHALSRWLWALMLGALGALVLLGWLGRNSSTQN